MKKLLTLALLFAATSMSQAAPVDEAGAKALAKANDCTKCHSTTKTKKGPSYTKIAQKYVTNKDAVAILTKQMTTEIMVEIDGQKEKHARIDATPAEVNNLVQSILLLK